MNILVIVLIVALVALWLFSKSSSANLKIPIVALALLAAGAFAYSVFMKGNSRALPPDLEKVERDAGFMLGSEMKALPAGPILVLVWSGGGFNPDPARLQGIKKAMGDGHPLIMGGAFVAGMEVDDAFVKLNPLTPEADLRAYLEKNKELAAVVILKPIRNWGSLKGLQSPPFYIFTASEDWDPCNQTLVRAAMVSQTRGRNAKGPPPTESFAKIEYQLVKTP